ncbi:acyl transferase [Euzebyella marina]|uniref:Acyl transferase n=1 Tax=Euzebyella marina TaxID=1761453 RepID=A0A3G2LAY2_9FLAO|nr:acyl transferase [Euzebyella marina]AYN69404.1 acyl transferase [Euzebyella marina]
MANQSIFNIATTEEFESATMETFQFQYQNNEVYRLFCDYLEKSPNIISKIEDIPFLPISFFKTHPIISGIGQAETVFTSSGTTGSQTSKHQVLDLNLYEESFLKGFELFYGDISDYCILALLPSYLERNGSSLIYMVDRLIKESKHEASGFYLKDLTSLVSNLSSLEKKSQKTLLIGVSFALLDLVEEYGLSLEHTIVMETGGMKGRRKELIREELHEILTKGFGVRQIHSEYGMTELLSQAYSSGKGIFKTPPWMKILIRDTEDPLSYQTIGKTGGINVIDLANRDSCSFIATQDLGKLHSDGSFEILGRFDHSDVRGCNLMVL